MAPLRCAAKFDPFLSLDCAPTPSTLARKGRDQILPSGNHEWATKRRPFYIQPLQITSNSWDDGDTANIGKSVTLRNYQTQRLQHNKQLWICSKFKGKQSWHIKTTQNIVVPIPGVTQSVMHCNPVWARHSPNFLPAALLFGECGAIGRIDKPDKPQRFDVSLD